MLLQGNINVTDGITAYQLYEVCITYMITQALPELRNARRCLLIKEAITVLFERNLLVICKHYKLAV